MSGEAAASSSWNSNSMDGIVVLGKLTVREEDNPGLQSPISSKSPNSAQKTSYQQSHWPTHMSTCAQNQSNDDDSSGAESNALSNSAFDAAVAGGHFLNNSVGKSVAPNGLGARASIQGGPAVMPMASMGVSPRLMSQMGMRFPPGGPGPGAVGHIRSPLRFPGPGGATYLM